MAGYGEQGREWQEMRGEQEPGQVGPHRPWQSLDFIQSPRRLVSNTEG